MNACPKCESPLPTDRKPKKCPVCFHRFQSANTYTPLQEAAEDRLHSIRVHWFYSILMLAPVAAASFFFGYHWHANQIQLAQINSNAKLNKEAEEAKVLMQVGKKDKAIESLAASLQIRGASDYAPVLALLNSLQEERRKELADKEDTTRASLNELNNTQNKLTAMQGSLRDEQAKLAEQKSQLLRLEIDMARFGQTDNSANLAEKFLQLQIEIREKLLSESKAALQSIKVAKRDFCASYRQGYEANYRQSIDYNELNSRREDLAVYFDSVLLLLEKIHEQYVLGNTSEADARNLLMSKDFVWNKRGYPNKSILLDCLSKLEAASSSYMPTVNGKQCFVPVQEAFGAFRTTTAWKSFISSGDSYKYRFSDNESEPTRDDPSR